MIYKKCLLLQKETNLEMYVFDKVYEYNYAPIVENVRALKILKQPSIKIL